MAKGNVLRKLEPVPQGQPEPVPPIRLDIGCGKTTPEGWVGIDAIDFGQKHVHDVRQGIPYEDNSVDEVRSSHFVEHLTGAERVAFFNDLWRVMKDGATASRRSRITSAAKGNARAQRDGPARSIGLHLRAHGDGRASFHQQLAVGGNAGLFAKVKIGHGHAQGGISGHGWRAGCNDSPIVAVALNLLRA